MMERYSSEVERDMKHFYDSLNEKDRRRYAAVESRKLGHGGKAYLSRLLGCDPDTITVGLAEVNRLPEDPAAGRVRKRGGAN